MMRHMAHDTGKEERMILLDYRDKRPLYEQMAEKLERLIVNGGLEPLIEKVHMLKGTAGNLSLTPIFNGYNRTLELLREGQPGKARAEFEAMRPVQEKLMDCIKIAGTPII